jgi:hypothetical protein
VKNLKPKIEEKLFNSAQNRLQKHLARKASAKSADLAAQRIGRAAVAFAYGGIVYSHDGRLAKQKYKLLALARQFRKAHAAYVAIQSADPATFQQILPNLVPTRMGLAPVDPPRLLKFWADTIDAVALPLKPKSGGDADSEVYELYYQAAVAWKDSTGSWPPHKTCKGGKDTVLTDALHKLVFACSEPAAKRVTASRFFDAMEQIGSGTGVAIRD